MMGAVIAPSCVMYEEENPFTASVLPMALQSERQLLRNWSCGKNLSRQAVSGLKALLHAASMAGWRFGGGGGGGGALVG